MFVINDLSATAIRKIASMVLFGNLHIFWKLLVNSYIVSKPIIFRLGEVLSFMPGRVENKKRYNNTMLFRMESEIPPTVPLRLKMF